MEYNVIDFIHYPKIDKEMEKLITSRPLYNIGDGSVFSYRFLVCSEDQNVVMWFLMFFNHSLLMSMSTKKGVMKGVQTVSTVVQNSQK